VGSISDVAVYVDVSCFWLPPGLIGHLNFRLVAVCQQMTIKLPA
jgi:hypothetical protein